MRDDLLPEAIRGAWFLVPDDDVTFTSAAVGLSADTLSNQGQLLALHLDGHFRRFEIKSAASRPGQPDQPTKLDKVEKETGDYTFDGDFLILRGRATETFRVRIDQDWSWALEARKKRRRLVRGLLGARDFFTLDPEECREIDTLAMRVGVESLFGDDSDTIFELVFRPQADEPLRLGCFSVDFDPQSSELWVGITPIAQNLGADTWQKIIAQSYLGLYRKNPDEIARVSVEILGTDVTREFSAR